MKIVVVAKVECCPAVVALRSERLDFELVIAEDEYTYGRTFKRYWEEGEKFINIEHDIVPWPGACRAMWECWHGYCMYQYPVGYSGKLGMALGMIMLDPQVYRGVNGSIWDEYQWNMLDGGILGSFRMEPHIHTPPVAHLTPLKEPNVSVC